MQVLSFDDLRDWQREIVDDLRGPPDDRTINWIYDRNGGTGKTALCKHIIATFPDVLFLSSSNAKDAAYQIIKRDAPYKIILINFPRQSEGHVSYSSFESIKDGLVFCGKYAGGFKLFTSPHIYIFANWPPDMGMLSQDRWNITEL